MANLELGWTRLKCSMHGSTMTLTLVDPRNGEEILSLLLTRSHDSATLPMTSMNLSFHAERVEITMDEQFTATPKTMLKRS